MVDGVAHLGARFAGGVGGDHDQQAAVERRSRACGRERSRKTAAPAQGRAARLAESTTKARRGRGTAGSGEKVGAKLSGADVDAMRPHGHCTGGATSDSFPRVDTSLRSGFHPIAQQQAVMTLSYEASGVRYDQLDAFKRACQRAAARPRARSANTAIAEPADTRGESAYLIEAADHYLAHVEEGLGTKNLVADAMLAADGQELLPRRSASTPSRRSSTT